MAFLYEALGMPYLRAPVWWPAYKYFAQIGLDIIRKLDAKARQEGIRPKIDVPMVEYITHQYWFSNQKLKNAGFKFTYLDPRKGLWEYIAWCKERGWLE
jgi:hypothetical protein